MAAVPKGFMFTPFSKFAPEKPPTYTRVIGNHVQFGSLADTGDFVPDRDLPVVSRLGLAGPLTNSPDTKLKYYNLPMADLRGKPEKVFEYRDGRLVIGTLDDTGNFTPEIGSKVMDFADYRYGMVPTRRIYNLPGRLRALK